MARMDISTHPDFQTRLFIFKVASRCNLNCSYCYMYNMGDTTYKRRPPTMSLRTASEALARIAEYCAREKITQILLTLHGGEPLLVKRKWYTAFFSLVDQYRNEDLHIDLALQTNATLLSNDWIDFLTINNVSFGISVDGPKQINDQFRVDHKGRGSYDAVERAIKRLTSHHEIQGKWGILIVANPQHSSVKILEHFRGLGVQKFDFLFPDFNHETRPPWPQSLLTQYYLELFDYWYSLGDSSVRIRLFESIIHGLLGRPTGVDAIGLHPISEVVVETDGGLEPLDVLRTCGNGFTAMGLNVAHNDIEDLRATSLFKAGLENTTSLSEKCLQCTALNTCGGGYLPHRFSKMNGFSNTSIHCETLYLLISHIFERTQDDLSAAMGWQRDDANAAHKN